MYRKLINYIIHYLSKTLKGGKMDYQESLKYIEETHKFGIRLGLDNMSKLLELLGNPQDKLNIIHVAGTNGKGSTCSFITSILKEAGYKVGLYTSPYLETFTERIRINGENIPEKDVARIVTLIKEKIEQMVSEGYSYPTEFEIVTTMAFYYYYEQGVDFVALEVGLGGRYDATNIIKKSDLSVITSISLDHVGILGDTVAKIAYEKAGIIKENGVVVVYDQSDEAKNVIKDICKEKNAKYIEVKFDDINIKKSNINSQVFDCTIIGQRYKDLEIKLIGDHQVNNSVLALSAIEILNQLKHLNINKDDIRRGLINTRWAGRIEKILDKPTFIIDGAHNEDGARSLAKAIEKNFDILYENARKNGMEFFLFDQILKRASSDLRDITKRKIYSIDRKYRFYLLVKVIKEKVYNSLFKKI